MDHAAAVRLVERVGDVDGTAHRLVDAHGPTPEPVLERFAFEALHHEEVDAVLVADVVQRADVRVIEAGDDLRFALEARAHRLVRGAARRKHLDRHGAIQPCIDGSIHLAHAARAQKLADFVAPQGSAWLDCHAELALIIGLP